MDRSGSGDGYLNLLGKIKRKKVSVGVVGLGYVGVPVLRAFKRAGFEVVGYDTNLDRALYVAELAECCTTIEPKVVGECDVFIVCVPTPVNGTEPDLGCVQDVAKALPKKGKLLVLESTVGPGDTERVFATFEWLAFSPEREDPGSGRDLTRIPKVLAGRDSQSYDAAALLYSHVFETVYPVSNIPTAEMSKLIENTYRAVNAAVANEFQSAGEFLPGVDVQEAITAASTKPFGFQAFYPGPGVGGHCIAVDPYYLLHAVSRPDSSVMPIVRQAMYANEQRPGCVAAEIYRRLPQPPTEKRILVCGVGYKGGIDDIRNSPAVKIIDWLTNAGYDMHWYDPLVNAYLKNGHKVVSMKDCEKYYCAVVLAAENRETAYAPLKQHPKVFDLRGYLPTSWPNVIRL